MARINDPLWTGNTAKAASYGFAASVFFLPVVSGFFLSQFFDQYALQIAGLIAAAALVGGFAAFSSHFNSKIPRAYFAGMGGLAVGYLLVHAGIGSNRGLSTSDQFDIGYLGIGLIYAMLLTAGVFTIYQLYKHGRDIYSNHLRRDNFFVNEKVEATPVEQ